MSTGEPALIKSCCAAAYESDFARRLLGGSFHPGGLTLTARLGNLLHLRQGMRVLDVASGTGETAIFLSRSFGCDVVGVDYSEANVRHAERESRSARRSESITFIQGDAENLEFSDNSFDAVICECALCTFPDKASATREFARVLRRPGRVGLSDLTARHPLPPDLEGLFSWIACVADARPADEYARYLNEAGFRVETIENHDSALAQMAREVQGRLMGIELVAKFKKLDLPGVDFEHAKRFARTAVEAIRQTRIGYSLITAACS
jgi:ubiquinone/menaquinone biosynthesis C-methylase UbiE